MSFVLDMDAIIGLLLRVIHRSLLLVFTVVFSYVLELINDSIELRGKGYGGWINASLRIARFYLVLAYRYRIAYSRTM